MVGQGACEAPPAESRRIAAEVWDAVAEAKRRLAEADAEARAKVDAARAEAEEIRRQAAAAGREEGLTTVSELAADLARAREQLLAEAEPQLVELAFAIAQRVLGRAVERDREVVVEVAQRALALARRRAEVTVRAHPDDLAALRAAEPRLLEPLLGAKQVAFFADAGVGRGGVRVETEAGLIDATLTSQIDALRRALAVTGKDGALAAKVLGVAASDGLGEGQAP